MLVTVVFDKKNERFEGIYVSSEKGAQFGKALLSQAIKIGCKAAKAAMQPEYAPGRAGII